MDELLVVLNDIKYELENMNQKLDDIKGMGLYNSLSDVNEKLDEVKGNGVFDSISDVNEKLDTISSTVDTIYINTL